MPEEKTEKPDSLPTISAAPDVCVSKSDTDGRWSFALSTDQPAAIHPGSSIPSTCSTLHGVAPIAGLHAPAYHATAPPICP